MSWIDPRLATEFAQAGTDSYRLANGRGWWVERFGDHVLISHPAASVPDEILAGLNDWLAAAKIEITHLYARRLVQGPGSQDAPRVLRGRIETSLVAENGVKFEVDFTGGYSCGLFLDQRANRARVRELRPARLLNCFAYTCSFSVVAALAGAQTLSVDLAQAALERGRSNFQHNGLSLEGHRFIADDMMDVLPRLARRGDRFEAIVLDPPTFARGRKGRIFRVEKELPVLLEMAAACAAEGAWILLSTNCSSLSLSDLRTMAYPFSDKLHVEPPLPDFPEASAATTLWLQV